MDALRSLAWRVLVILAFVSAPTLLGQVRDNVPTRAAPPVLISGRVITGETDQPVPRVRVALQAANVAPVLTAEDGTFEISVPSGAGALRLSKSGFAPVSVDRRALLPNTQLLVQMARGAAVNGVVLDSTGAPAPNVMVRVRRVNDGTPVSGGGGQSIVETNDLGEFRVGNLTAGRYTVEPGGGGRGGRGGFVEAFASPDIVRGLVDGLGDRVNIRQILDLAAGRGAPAPQATQNGQAAQGAAPQDAPVPGRGGRGGRGRGRGEPTLAANAQTVDLRVGEEANLTLSFDSPEQVLVDIITSLPRPATAPAGAVVRGRVIGWDARPIKGAIVRLNPAGNGAAGRSAVTDASGVWEMQGITAGSYRARISKSGLADVEFGQRRSLQPGRIINVGQNSRVTGIDVSLPKPSVIAGSVLNRWGEPVEGLSVHVWQSSFVDGRLTLSEVSGARPRRTDDRGRYRIFNLLPGSYYVVAIEQSQQEGRGPDADTSGARVFFPGVTSATSASRIDVEAGQDAAGIDITYVPSPGARIDGYAMASNGQPGRGRAVLAVSQRSGEPLVPVRTSRIESTGRFTFSEVPGGDYVVQVVPGGPGEGGDGRGGGRGGAPAGGRNGGNGANGANGANGNGGGFGGRGAQGNATGNGGAQASAGVAGAGGQAGQAGQTAQAGAAQGGQRGRGAGAPAVGSNAGAQGARGGNGGGGGRGGRGAQQLNAARLNAEAEFGMTYVTVNDGEAVAVRVETSPAVTMNGQVVFEGDATNVAPGSVAFSAYPTDGDLSPMVGGRQVRADVRQDGTFTIARLSGPVRIGQTRAPDGWYLKSAVVNGVNAVEIPVSLNRGDASVASVTVTFANGTAGIEGSVVDDRRQPSGEFGVVVFSSDQSRWFSRSPYIKLGTPAQDGTFSVTGLPPGEYLATAIDQIDGGTDFGSWQNPAVLATLAPTARRFTLAAGQTATTELRLIRR